MNAASGKMAEGPKAAGGKSSECAPQYFPSRAFLVPYCLTKIHVWGMGTVLNS